MCNNVLPIHVKTLKLATTLVAKFGRLGTIFGWHGSTCERYNSFCEQYGSFCERQSSFCEQYGSFFERHGSFCEQYALTKKWLQALWTVRFDFFYYNFVYFFSEGLQQGVYYEKPFFSNRYFYDILQMYFKLIKIRTPMRYSVFNTLCKTCLPSLLSESGV